MIRLAHFTDLHLRHALPGTSPVPARRSRGGLERFSGALEIALSDRPDCIVVTGDLIDAPEFWTDGMPKGFAVPNGAAWRHAMLADYSAIKALLDSCSLPWRAIPGNHDAIDEFREVFGPSLELSCKGYRIVSFEDHEHAGHYPRRYIPSRELFEAVLHDSSDAPQVHLQHYLLQDIPGQGYPHTYAEHEMLRAAIAQSGRVRLCLSGHYHKGTTPAENEGTV